ncbi:MAG: sulfotransferase [Cyanobacteria bacterium P01_H01_bin.15]
MTLPNFLIVGAAKSGTTSLWHYLKQHPQIFFTRRKEPNFFAFKGLKLPPFSGPASPDVLYKILYQYSVTSDEKYQSLFENSAGKIAIGEASVRYLYFPEAAKRINEYIPNAKIIIILRNPIYRLYSHYIMMRGKYLLEPLPLVQALEQEGNRIQQNWGWDWHYVQVGMYYKQVQRYFELFGKDQVKVFLYDDFSAKPLKIIQDICRFIRVDDNFFPDMSRKRMPAYWPKNFVIDSLIRNPNPLNSTFRKILPKDIYKRVIRQGMLINGRKPPALSSKMKTHLQTVFQENIANLETLIERDLPW